MQFDASKGKIRCLQCGYPLLGLPPAHFCPECGLAYDPCSRLYRLRPRRHGIAAGACFFITMAALTALPVKYSWVRSTVAFAAGATLMIWATRSLWPNRRSQPRLLIDRFGIRLEQPGRPDTAVPWSQFSKAHLSWFSGRIWVYAHAGRRRLRLESNQFGTSVIAQRAVDHMNELARIYAGLE